MPKTFYESEVVRLADLALVRTQLDGYEFRDCLLLGPAIVLGTQNVSITNCGLGGETSAIFWLVEAGREFIVGAIGFSNTIFDGCQFQGVGFAGPEETRAMLDATLKGEEP